MALVVVFWCLWVALFVVWTRVALLLALLLVGFILWERSGA